METHLPERVVVADRVDDLAHNPMLIWRGYGIYEGRCDALRLDQHHKRHPEYGDAYLVNRVLELGRRLSSPTEGSIVTHSPNTRRLRGMHAISEHSAPKATGRMTDTRAACTLAAAASPGATCRPPRARRRASCPPLLGAHARARQPPLPHRRRSGARCTGRLGRRPRRWSMGCWSR